MKVLIIGSEGMLGHDLVDILSYENEVKTTTIDTLDITNIDKTIEIVKEINPDVVVHAAAFTDVDGSEANPDLAYKVNALGTRNVAVACSETDSAMVYICTDYVFDGSKGSPYEEADCPRPLNVYGNTKLAGEYFVRCGVDMHFVVRTSGLFGKAPCRAKGGRNFVDLMLKLAKDRGEVKVVDSEWVTPTSTRELARQIVVLSRSDAFGLYHATAEGACSWYEFAHEIFAITDTPVSLKVAGPNEFPAKVPRPKYSVLENRALKLQGLNAFATWQDGLREYLGVAQSHAAAQSR